MPAVYISPCIMQTTHITYITPRPAGIDLTLSTIHLDIISLVCRPITRVQALKHWPSSTFSFGPWIRVSGRTQTSRRHTTTFHLTERNHASICVFAPLCVIHRHTQPINWWIQVVLTLWCLWVMSNALWTRLWCGTSTENKITDPRSIQRSKSR
jgi:hypothetical protein